MARTSPSGTGRLIRYALCAAILLCFISGDLFAEGKPESAFDWGCRLRLRQEYSENLSDFSNSLADDNNYLRVRSQLWGSWAPGAQWKLYAMLNNEHRHWYKSNKGLEYQEFEIHELVFENLYVEGTKIGGTPFGFIAGRQNLLYGEGFICWDGGPLDGSRTAYFNALVLTASFDKRRLDAHVLSGPERDRYLPIVNDQKQSMIEWDERGAGLYYTDESFDGRKLEAYYFFKNEKDESDAYPESDIHTIGARAAGKGFGRLTFAVEGAVQTGDRGAQKRLGYGGYLYGKYALPIERVPIALGAGSFYLSGDKPGSKDTYEGWDPVYSRWPKWSELYIYSLAKERGAAYWENVASLWFGLEVKPLDRIALEERIYPMWAPEPPPKADKTLFGAGSYRGTLSIMKLSGTLNTYLSAYLLWEALFPGDYYFSGSDTAHFLRWEIMFKY
ncbi:MAG: alginate export family protein [Candidatus Krumholzibacteria bacterium]|nr:alginate export family protein [Candidatus Krumholzibacteria bacterium]